MNSDASDARRNAAVQIQGEFHAADLGCSDKPDTLARACGCCHADAVGRDCTTCRSDDSDQSDAVAGGEGCKRRHDHAGSPRWRRWWTWWRLPWRWRFSWWWFPWWREDISAVSAAVAFTAAISAASAPRRPFTVAAIATADFAAMAVFIATGSIARITAIATSTGAIITADYYPYYNYPRRCRVIWTYYGPRRVCRWHRWHYPYRYW